MWLFFDLTLNDSENNIAPMELFIGFYYYHYYDFTPKGISLAKKSKMYKIAIETLKDQNFESPFYLIFNSFLSLNSVILQQSKYEQKSHHHRRSGFWKIKHY
jgi:hypothetical protein